MRRQSKTEKKSNVTIVRMAETEHMRLKLWAKDRGTDMSKVIRDRLSDIIVQQARHSQDAET